MSNFDVVIIGAGISGSLVALKIPNKYKVLLIEHGNEIIPKSSSTYNECYKLHTGVHYIGDIVTAEKCLRKSIEFAREYGHVIAGGNQLNSPWRRGRHFIMSNSLINKEHALIVISHLQKIYSDLVQADPKNKVFGEVDDFIKFLKKEDFAYIADDIPFIDGENNSTSVFVDTGIETAESQIDIDLLRNDITTKISERDNITFLTNHKVRDVSYKKDEFGYVVRAVNNSSESIYFSTTALLNCSWQNIETIDNSIGLYTPDEYRVTRAKVSILIDLPDKLKNINTCIFSAGPYCSITILPNGTAILTNERITNIGHYKPLENNLTYNQLTLDSSLGKKISQEILQGCASYLTTDLRKDLCKANIRELRVGYVKIMHNKEEYTFNSIYKKDSVIHARDVDGIEELGLGYIAISGMKMTYAVGNANKVPGILDSHFIIKNKVEYLIAQLKNYIENNKNLIDESTYINYKKYENTFWHITCRENLIKVVISEAFKNNEEDSVAKLANDCLKTLKYRSVVLNSIKFFQNNIDKNQHNIINIKNIK